MNAVIQHKKTTRSFLATVVLACSVLLPQVQAVSPTPDGCYPNFTTAEGCDALNSLMTGAGNTGLGWRSLFLNTDGGFNTGVGAGALALNKVDSNTAVGAAALLLNVGGNSNTAVGTDAMVYNDVGSWNTAVGAFALFNNINGIENAAFGFHALYSNGQGTFNNAFGAFALELQENGSFNNAFGEHALGGNVFGSNNTAVGDAAGFGVTGDHNTSIGAVTMETASSGSENTVLGFSAGNNIVTGAGNIYIGVRAGDPTVIPDEFAVIRIGEPNPSIVYDCYIQGIDFRDFGVGVPQQVFVTDDGKLANPASSRRLKHDIKPIDKASEVILALKPVSFHYNNDAKNIPFFGLIAEDVAKVSADLVAPDKEGKPYSVRYDQVNAMLLNEFLKEHRKVEQQRKDFEAALAQQQKQIDALTAGLQKVSAQLEVSKAAPRTVVANE
jgi:hypothetical protein